MSFDRTRNPTGSLPRSRSRISTASGAGRRCQDEVCFEPETPKDTLASRSPTQGDMGIHSNDSSNHIFYVTMVDETHYLLFKIIYFLRRHPVLLITLKKSLNIIHQSEPGRVSDGANHSYAPHHFSSLRREYNLIDLMLLIINEFSFSFIQRLNEFIHDEFCSPGCL